MLSDDDRELLRLAAIACGELHGEWVGNDAYFDGVLSRWNPITDDGDALRLAVKLDLIIEPPRRPGEAGDPGWAHVYHYRKNLEITEKSAGDRNASVRRAIVRAAAEIGRQHD